MTPSTRIQSAGFRLNIPFFLTVFWLLIALSPVGARPKIINGNDADAGAYPWMVALVDPTNPDGVQGHGCGGTLIHPRYVLTAAHCVVNLASMTSFQPSELAVRIDLVDLADSTVETHSVNQIITHENFQRGTRGELHHDVALIRLHQPITNLPVLRLNETSAFETPGLIARAIGWGTTDAAIRASHRFLQEVDLPLTSRAVASAAPSQFLITTGMVAAGFSNGGFDTCIGDSGGPLLMRDPVDQAWIQIGITSFGTNPCAMTGEYGIYSSTFAYRHWIWERIMPGYRDWEIATGIEGLHRDSDDDGSINLHEYTSGTDGGDRHDSSRVEGIFLRHENNTFAGVRLLLHTNRLDTFLTVEAGDSLQDDAIWTDLPAANVIGSVSNRPAVASFDMRDNLPLAAVASPARFFRSRVQFNPNASAYVDASDILVLDLTDEDPVWSETDASRWDGFRLKRFTPGTPLRIDMQSGHFDCLLVLVSTGPDGETLLQNDDGGLGTNARIQFTPEAGHTYDIFATSAFVGERGRYTLIVQ